MSTGKPVPTHQPLLLASTGLDSFVSNHGEISVWKPTDIN